MRTSKDMFETPVGPEPMWGVFNAFGLRCLILRHEDLGHLCGYVKLPKEAEEYAYIKETRKKFNRISFMGASRRSKRKMRRKPTTNYKVMGRFQCHGGVTFAGTMNFYLADRGLWIGFDCAHHNDVSPLLIKMIKDSGGNASVFDGATYCTFDYVKDECMQLAAQIVYGLSEGEK